MAELNIETFEQEIFNVVLKTVTEQNSGGAETIKVYNNDLTASLMVALDSNNSLPYTPAAATSETLGFYPWKPTIPAPYRYYFYVPRTLSVTYTNDTAAVTDTVGATDAYNSRFLTIENTTPITLLRTGDEFATGSYKFDCEPLKLTHLWQNNRALGMPPLLGALPTNDNPIPIQKTNSNRLGQSQIQNSNLLTEVTRLRPAQIGFAQPHDTFEASDSGPFKVPLISMFPTSNNDYDGNGNVRYMYSKQHGASYAQQAADYIERYTYEPAACCA
uniref:Capsid protein 1 n=1 Tax=Protoparvovirus rodent3 TaxID=3052719 RepID=A0A2Z3D7D9_9VIRU|nr:capsid protein 1 [Protoparvovirus rodent3]